MVVHALREKILYANWKIVSHWYVDAAMTFNVPRVGLALILAPPACSGRNSSVLLGARATFLQSQIIPGLAYILAFLLP